LLVFKHGRLVRDCGTAVRAEYPRHYEASSILVLILREMEAYRKNDVEVLTNISTRGLGLILFDRSSNLDVLLRSENICG
jgi:hypothetical protein